MAVDRRRRVIVVGGSIGGLFAALLLRRDGWDVHVSERAAAPLPGSRAGIVTHPQLWRILEGLGLDPHAEFGVAVRRRVTLARNGTVAGTLDCPQVMTSWDRLFRMLRGAWPDDRCSLGEELRSVACGDEGGVARFGNGVVREAELLVGRMGSARRCGGYAWGRQRRITPGMWLGGG